MTMAITPLYAGLVTLFFVLLSVRVIRMRRSSRIGLGDGGNRALLRRARAHANFAEYVPLALVLMALVELQEGSTWTLHLIGALIIAGRLIHAFGISREPENGRLRVFGIALTLAALITGALANLGVTGLAATIMRT